MPVLAGTRRSPKVMRLLRQCTGLGSVWDVRETGERSRGSGSSWVSEEVKKKECRGIMNYRGIDELLMKRLLFWAILVMVAVHQV